MAAVTSLVVGQIIGAGINAWSNWYAMKEARKESRRSEKLRIKFSEKESRAEESRFQRGLAFQKSQDRFQRKITTRQQNLNESQARIQTKTALTDRLVGLFENSRNASVGLINMQRSRRR